MISLAPDWPCSPLSKQLQRSSAYQTALPSHPYPDCRPNRMARVYKGWYQGGGLFIYFFMPSGTSCLWCRVPVWPERPSLAPESSTQPDTFLAWPLGDLCCAPASLGVVEGEDLIKRSRKQSGAVLETSRGG